jgi:hypothetical protein
VTYKHFSFALVCERFDSEGECEVAILSGSVLAGDALEHIKSAVQEWLLTDSGVEAIEECNGKFTMLDLAEYYYPPIEDMLNARGVIDFQIDIEPVYSGALFLDQDLSPPF